MKQRIFLSMLLLVGAMAASVGEANAQSSTSQDVPNVVHGKSDGTPSKKNEIYYSDYVYFNGKVDKKTKTPSGKGDLVILQKQAKYTSNIFNSSVAYYVNGIFDGNQVTNAHLHIPGGDDFYGDLSYEVYDDIVKFKLLNGKLGTRFAKDNEYVVNINDYSFSTDMDIYVVTGEKMDRVKVSSKLPDWYNRRHVIKRISDAVIFIEYKMLEFDTVSTSGVNIINWKYNTYYIPADFELTKDTTIIKKANTRGVFDVGDGYYYYESTAGEILTDFNGNYLTNDTIHINHPSLGLIHSKFDYEANPKQCFTLSDGVYNIDGKLCCPLNEELISSIKESATLKDLNGQSFDYYYAIQNVGKLKIGRSSVLKLRLNDKAPFNLSKLEIDKMIGYIYYNSKKDMLEGKWAGYYGESGLEVTRDELIAAVAKNAEKSNVRIKEKQAEEKRKEAEYKRLCQKWGKANVDLVKYEGKVKVGMPVELLKEYCKMGCAYESGNVAKWEVYTLPHDKEIFTLDSRYDGYHLIVWTRNGKVTSISYR